MSMGVEYYSCKGHWREWQPIPVFLPGESHGQRRLVGYSAWDHKESDMTETIACMQHEGHYILQRHRQLGNSWKIEKSRKFKEIFCFTLFFFFLRVFFFNYFILFLNFTILYWFCQTSKWICHRYTCVPHSEPSSLLPPHTIPLGHPSAPAPSIQYRASNLDWRLISYMILYMFQYHSPKSSHPLPLPQSP